MKFEIIVYTNSEGKEPFTEWIKGLDMSVRHRMFKRLNAVALGNFGDCKKINSDVYELRFFFGSGYRIYFGKDGDRIVVLLCGGDKASQKKDIQKAEQLWREYSEKIQNP